VPRRRRHSKRRATPLGWNGRVPAPWEAMDAEAERAAVAAYSEARRLGGCPVHREGEPIRAYHERVGTPVVFTCWAAARFDRDPALRRLALVAGVDHYRRAAIGWPSRDHDGPRRGEFSSWRLVRFEGSASPRRRALQGDGAGALRDLAVAAEPFGLLVTEDGVRDLRSSRRSNTTRRLQ